MDDNELTLSGHGCRHPPFQNILFMQPERFGEYTLHERLNEGGTAEVFFATNSRGEGVALRRLRPDYKFSLSKRSGFRHGMEIQMQMNGPHVVHVFELQTRKMVPYAVMEYIDGVNLRQALLRRDEFLPHWTNAFALFEGIAKGLGEIHHRGSMHLDMKPENVMLNRAGEVKILDFDLARRISKQPVALSSVDGTPSYLAPELILREPVDERTDIFSLGILGYELFTGQKPFTAPTHQELFRAYTTRNVAFPPPVKLDPSLPQTLNDIILHCIEKKFELRYPAVALILRDLRKVKLPATSSTPEHSGNSP